MKGCKDALMILTALRRKKTTATTTTAISGRRKTCLKKVCNSRPSGSSFEYFALRIFSRFFASTLFFLMVCRLSLQGLRSEGRPRQPWVTTISRIEASKQGRKEGRYSELRKNPDFLPHFHADALRLARKGVCTQKDPAYKKNERIKGEECLIYARHVRQSDALCMEMKWKGLMAWSSHRISLHPALPVHLHIWSRPFVKGAPGGQHHFSFLSWIKKRSFKLKKYANYSNNFLMRRACP